MTVMADLILFSWQAFSDSGKKHTGYTLCASRAALTTKLSERNLLLIYCRKEKKTGKRQWNNVHKIAFFNQLATLLKAGLSLVDSLRMLAEGHPDLAWHALLTDLSHALLQGISFAQALRQWETIFSPIWSALVEAGELTGQLETCCRKLAVQQSRQDKLHATVIKVMRYPLFILCVVIAVASAMLLWVLPQFTAIYQSFNAPLPAFTHGVISLSQWLRRTGFWLLCLLLLLIFSLIYLYRHSTRWRRAGQYLLLRIPLVATLWRGSKLHQIFTTLALAQRAGMTLLQGLQIAQQTVLTLVWFEALSAIQNQIVEGQTLHQAIEKHPLFTAFCYQLIKTGEEAGALEEMLIQLANWHETLTHALAEDLSAALEPIIMLVTGVIVGALVIAMYLPVFGLGDILG